jgi:hypothetical protein
VAPRALVGNCADDHSRSTPDRTAADIVGRGPGHRTPSGVVRGGHAVPMSKSLPLGPTVIDDGSEVRFVAGTDQFAIRLKDGHLHVRAIDTVEGDAQLSVVPTSKSTLNLRIERRPSHGPVEVEGPTVR